MNAKTGESRDDVGDAESAAWRWIGTLFFAEGLPATVVSMLSAILLKRLGVSNGAIALYASTLTLPWSLKPLWSPLVEVFWAKHRLIVVMEATVAVALAGAAGALALHNRIALCLSFFALIAVAAATHDIAADGLYLCVLPPSVQARYVGWLSVAFNMAKFATQGLLVIVAGALELRRGVTSAWQVVFAALSAVMALLSLYHLGFLPASPAPVKPKSLSDLGEKSTTIVRTFFRQDTITFLIALVLFYRFAEGQLIRIVPLFLLDSRNVGGLGVSTAELGAFYGGLGAAVFMIGAVTGGWWSARVGLQRALVPLCIAFNLPALVYLFLSWRRPASLWVIGGALVAEQFVYGIGTIGLKLVMMQRLAEGRYRTAHFAFATGLAGIGATVAGMISGRVQSRIGYQAFFVWVLVAALPAVWLAHRCSSRSAPDSAPVLDGDEPDFRVT